MNYKLEQALARMKNLLEMRGLLQSTYCIRDVYGDDDGYYAELNEAYKKLYEAFDTLITDEAARIGRMAKE